MMTYSNPTDEPIEIIDNTVTVQVTCQCGRIHTVTRPVVQHRSSGAWYEKKWVQLKYFQTNMLQIWLSSHPKGSLPKDELIKLMRNNGLKFTDKAFDGRLSELKSAGPDHGSALVIASDNIKQSDDAQRTKHAPHYSLNIQKVIKVLNPCSICLKQGCLLHE